MLSRGRAAYSTLLWVGFLLFVLLPLMVLSIGLGRYFYARAEMYKAADGAALAAAREVDIPHFIETGEVVLLPSAYAVARQYAHDNSDYLYARAIRPEITRIYVDQARDTVFVRLRADASSLFPTLLGDVTVTGEGEAQVRLQRR